MKDRTGCIVILLCLLVIANLAGLYFIIDSQSRFTQALAQNNQALSRIAEQLRKVKFNSYNPNANSGAQTVTIDGDFANAEFYQPQRQSGGRRISYTTSFSGGLNLMVLNEAVVSLIWETVTDQLATRNLMDTSKFEPMLAEKWEVSEDGLEYTITLKKGILWHPYTDPITKKNVPEKEVTADDFIFYWEILQNEDIPCDAQRSTTQLIKLMKKIDRYTFKVIWKEPYSKAEEVTLGMTPIPRHYYRPNPEWDDKKFAQEFTTSVRNQFLIGCGAYRLTEWKKGLYMSFDRFDKYYGIKPAITHVKIREISDTNIALVEFRKGKVDAIGLTPEQWVKEAVGEDFHLVTPDVSTSVEDSVEWDDRKQKGQTPKIINLKNSSTSAAHRAGCILHGICKTPSSRTNAPVRH